MAWRGVVWGAEKQEVHALRRWRIARHGQGLGKCFPNDLIVMMNCRDDYLSLGADGGRCNEKPRPAKLQEKSETMTERTGVLENRTDTASPTPQNRWVTKRPHKKYICLHYPVPEGCEPCVCEGFGSAWWSSHGGRCVFPV